MTTHSLRQMVFAALATPLTIVSAQYQTTYDWYAHSAPALARVTAGETIRFTITNENRLCFAYVVNASITAAADIGWTDAVKALSGAGDPLTKLIQPPPAPPKNNPPPPPPPAAGGRGGHAQPSDAVAAIRAKAVEELEAALKASNDAYDAVLNATRPIDDLKESDDKAAKASKDYLDAACAGERGAANFVSLWTEKTRPVVSAFVALVSSSLPKVKKDVANAKPLVELAAAEMAVFKANAAKDPVYKEVLIARQNDITRNDDALASLNKRVTDADAAIAKLADDAKVMDASISNIDKATSVTSETKTVGTTDNTASVSVTIVATGVIGAAKGRVITDEIPIPVYRRIRSFISAGFLLSTLPEHSYDRANVVDGEGKAYSTFVDRSPGSTVAFAPAVMVNITLSELSRGVDVTATGGMALRSVADKSFVDFLIGPSLTVRDIAGITVAYHKGRIEKLLIGDPDVVRTKPVPDEVTRPGAVGLKWADAIALVFSIKFP